MRTLSHRGQCNLRRANVTAWRTQQKFLDAEKKKKTQTKATLKTSFCRKNLPLSNKSSSSSWLVAHVHLLTWYIKKLNACVRYRTTSHSSRHPLTTTSKMSQLWLKILGLTYCLLLTLFSSHFDRSGQTACWPVHCVSDRLADSGQLGTDFGPEVGRPRLQQEIHHAKHLSFSQPWWVSSKC